MSLILETAHEAFVSMDASGTVVEWNPEAERTFGWSRAEVIGRELAETIIPERHRPAHRRGLKRFLSTGEGRVLNHRFEIEALHRTGHEFPVELTIAAVNVEGGYAFNAFLHDVSERKQLEAYLTAQNAVSKVLIRSAPLAETMPELLRALGESLGWQVGAFWNVDAGGEEIHCESVWSDPGLSGEAFMSLTEEARFGPGTGLPGQVWESGEPTWIERYDETDFPRARWAAQAGLHSALCLPLRSDGRVHAVIEFYCRERRQMDEGLLQLHAHVSDHVGLYLERRRVEQELKDEATFLRAVLDSIEEGIVACDLNGVLTADNAAARTVFGLADRSVSPELWAPHYNLFEADGTTPLSREDVPLYRALQGERFRSAEFVVAPENGETLLIRANGQPLTDSEGVQRGAVVAMNDITEVMRAEAELAHQALHDPLTGLPNRTLLLDRVEHALELAKRSPATIAVLFLDLDNFKAVNDGYGHGLGNELLKLVGTRLESMLRSSDTASRLGGRTVARLGGDEFVVLCEGLDSARDGVRIAERLRDGLAAPFKLAGQLVTVTTSIGITFPHGPETDAESLVRDADVAMYRAKEGGRNRYELFSEEMRTRVLERLRMERDLRAAMELDQFELQYQPIVALADETIVGVEALACWTHPERGLVSPADFISVAEEIGLVVPLGAWVLQEACQQLAAWDGSHRRSPPLTMSVNVSAHQLTVDFLDVVSRALSENGLEPERLVLEVTERVMLEQDDTAKLLRELAKLGVRLALDDFGTGYSSLAYLTKFPFEELKVDRSLVEAMGNDRHAGRVTAAAVDMGRALEMCIVGEGVETAAQAAGLKALGCEYAQGYHFARPQSAGGIAKLLGDPAG